VALQEKPRIFVLHKLVSPSEAEELRLLASVKGMEAQVPNARTPDPALLHAACPTVQACRRRRSPSRAPRAWWRMVHGGVKRTARQMQAIHIPACGGHASWGRGYVWVWLRSQIRVYAHRASR
jgi:hypothetical protein